MRSGIENGISPKKIEFDETNSFSIDVYIEYRNAGPHHECRRD